MQALHKARREWTPQRPLDWGERIGPSTRQIVEHQLTYKPYPEMGYRACLGLLSLARRYGNERTAPFTVLGAMPGAPRKRSRTRRPKGGEDRKVEQFFIMSDAVLPS